MNFDRLICESDLIKVDAEEHDHQLTLSTTSEDWESADALIEIQSPENVKIVYGFLLGIDVSMCSQKINWGKLTSFNNMPTSYKVRNAFYL